MYKPIFIRVVSVICMWMFLLCFTKTSLANYSEETFDMQITNPSLWQEQYGQLSFDSDTDASYSIFSLPNVSNSYIYYRTFDFSNNGIVFDYAYLQTKLISGGVTQGAGIIFSDNTPSFGDQLVFSDLMFFVWPKPDGTFHLFTNICPSVNPSCNINTQIANGVYEFESNVWIDIKIERINNHYEVYVNNQVEFSTVDISKIINSIGFGSPITTTNTQVWPKFYVDYLGVNNEPAIVASFPFLSQLDPAWKDEEYDTATSWVEGEGAGIGDWGCALTSAAMVLQKYEVKSPTNGADTTPSNLNNWLLAETDGYVRGGLINWLAVTRYALLAKEAGYSPTALEYERKPYDAVEVKTDIDNGLYPILNLPGHFIVAYEDQNSDWGVADPLESAVGTQTKTDEVLRSNILKSSNTDLGYFLFVTSVDTKVELRDENGNLVPIDESTEWLAKGRSGTDGPKYKQIYVAKPATGIYKLYLENTSVSEIPLDIYTYASDGKVAEQSYSQEGNKSEVYEIDYDKATVSQGSIVMLDTTPPTFDNTTVFSGWYNTKKIAEFNYSDLNMVSDYTAPNCEISTEGLGQTCSVTPLICDTAGNCNSTTQISNGADIDLVKPSLELKVWGRVLSGKANDSLSGLKEVLIELTKPGETMSTVKATGTSDWEYVISDAKIGEYKISVTAYDEAGNGSEKIEKSYWINASEEPTAVTMGSTTETNSESIELLDSIIANPWGDNQITIESPLSEETADEPENGGIILGESTSGNSTKYKDLWLLIPITISGGLSYYFRRLSKRGYK